MTDSPSPNQGPRRMKYLPLIRSLIILILSIAVIAFAVLRLKSVITNRPPPPKAEPRLVIPTVEVLSSASTSAFYSVEIDGLVSPYWQTELSAQVSGEVIEIAQGFEEGLMVKKGDLLLRIEATEYEGLVAQRRAAIAQSEQAIAEEEASGLQAAKDWTRSGRKLEDAQPLTLRKPQIATAHANLESAKIGLELAQLHLERTKITAPYDGIVQSRKASLGMVASPGLSLGSLLGTERLQVRFAISPKLVSNMNLPYGGRSETPIEITIRPVGAPHLSWPAQITRTDTQIDTDTRMFHVFADVLDPLKDPNQPLPVGAFVTATLAGESVENVHRIPESALINDTRVWTLSDDKTILSVPVRRIFSKAGEAYIRFADMPDATRNIVLQPLPSFRDGMTVSIHDEGGEL